MSAPAVMFCSFSQLHNWTHSESRIAQCVYIKPGNSSCKRHISRQNRDFAKSLLVTVSKSATPSFEVFGELAKFVICSSHAKYAVEAKEQWYKEHNSGKGCISVQVDACHPGENDVSLNGIIDISSYIELPDSYSAENASLPAQPPPATRTFPTPDRSEEEIAKTVTQKVEQPLGTLDKVYGHVYICSSPSFPGLFKVGYTQPDPKQQRFKDHKVCYPDMEEVKTAFIYNAHRVEKLIHAEFSHVRCDLVCQGKHSSHKEWFQIDKETLLASLEKWTEFVKTHPYNSQGNLKRNVTLPEPASAIYLRCPRCRSSPCSTPPRKAGSDEKKRRESSKLGSPSPPARNFRVSASTCMSSEKTEPKTETDSDDEPVSFLASKVRRSLKMHD
ncbi:hypothetical protein N7532_011678 [Penicillium argentinense]|uniref:Bacteriophage T5 Orf172 DNA-binding domain-containing protein n=1 Tax=Penicillium argentinense TaxID=1131581 RepID=A0A9W9JV65_9EURO|nr:uncharacterized protein N7532_011678 [Penicillium argentinense]KAJ5082635.1 hypothetical protein N7532_011678 [Penicillium argentinense]